MNFRKVVILLLVFSFLTACGQGIATMLIPTVPMITPTGTIAPSPTVTPLPTATQFPSLSGKPPYLVLRQDYYAQELVVYDHDGSGRRIIELPKDGHIMGINSSLRTIISPNGKWLVFYTGSVDIGEYNDNLPVTLKLLNIEDGTIRNVVDVVKEGYQKKLEKVADDLKKLDPEYYQPIDGIDWVAGSTISAFQYGIYSVSWSPDNRYLAFAGQIDGISSDIYFYDMESGAIQRVNDDIQSVSRIQWSPDGKYIVFENSIPGMTYTGRSLYAIKPGSTIVKNPKPLQSGTWWSTREWLSPSLLLGSQGSDTAGENELQTIDISTGRINYLWEGFFSDYAIDYKGHIIALNSGEFAQPEKFGLYFITFDGSQKKVFDGLYWLSLFFRGGEKHRFLVTGISYKAQYDLAGDAFGIDIDNKLTFLGKFNYQQISVSPDYSWLLMYNDQVLNLYDKNDELVQTFSIPNVSQVLWRPDSQVIFYLTGGELYYLSLPNGKPLFVDKCLVDKCIFDFDGFHSTWLP